MSDESKSCKLNDFEQIALSPNGNINECSRTWTGVLAMLLRLVAIDKHDFAHREDTDSEKVTYPQLVELITDKLTFNSPNISPGNLASLRSTLIKQISDKNVSIKILGEFLSLLDPEFIDLTLTLKRQSGTIKSYTIHIGTNDTKELKKRDEEYFANNPHLHENKMEIMNETILSKVRKVE